MIRFKTFINEDVLLENRIEFLKQQNPTIDTTHDTLAKHKDAGAIIDHFAKKADPTPTKAHTQWIVNQYKKQTIRQEDAPQIKSTLNDFETVKPRLEKKDLNQYKDIGELRDAVATQKSQAEKVVKAKKTTAANKSADLEKMYDEDGVTGYKIPNKESSIRNYGPAGEVKQTHWCTAANSGNNMFNHYKGGKYTMHFPNGEVLQFHHQSNQIMDKYDRRVEEGDPRFAPYEHHITKFIHQTKPLESDSKIDRFHHYEPYEIDDAIAGYKKRLSDSNNDPTASGVSYHHTTKNLTDISEKAKLSDKQFDAIHSLPIGKDYLNRPEGVPLSLSKNKKLTHEQVGKLLGAHDEKVLDHHEEQLAQNPVVKDEHIDALLKSPRLSKEAFHSLANNPNLKQHHIDALIKDPETHDKLGSNHAITLTKDHQDQIIDSGKWKEGFAHRSDLHPDTVEHLLGSGYGAHIHTHLVNNPHVEMDDRQLRSLHAQHNRGESAISGAIFDSPKTSPETREHVFNTHMDHLERSGGGSSPALDTMIRSKHFTKDHLDRVLDVADKTDKQPGATNTMRIYASRYLKASPAQLDRQVNASKQGTAPVGYLLDNKNLKPEHLKTLFNAAASSKTEYEKEKVMEHPSINGDVLHHVFDSGHSWDRTRVLHHPKVQMSHFQKAMDVGQSLHGAISSSPSAPPSTLSKLADSPFSFVRQNIASHKNTPQETLANLANDSAEEVSSIAKKRLKLK
jgi:hypothetical protein